MERQIITQDGGEIVDRSPWEWKEEIRGAWLGSVTAVLETGRLLNESKASLQHGEWLDMFEGDNPLPFSDRTAERLMRIERHPSLANPTHVSNLPQSWGTLYELSRFEPEAIEAGIESGEIHPEMTRSDVSTIRRGLASGDEAPPLPDDKYRIIYADPPWEYGPSGATESANYGGTKWHYNTMSNEELVALLVRDLAADNAVLFIWVTSPKLNEVWPIIDAWGFEYKTSFVWDKVRHNFGYYNSVRHELLLICGRGSSTPDVAKLHDSVQVIERQKSHSTKPEEFRQIIDEIYPHGKRIELFARQSSPGWDTWGNEA